MNVLPVLDRELRIAARWKSTYWSRSVIGILVLAIWGLIVYVGTKERIKPTEISYVLFVCLNVLCFVISMFAGIGLTTDIICREKRQGTLGLLFLTNLSSFDIILGKLSASSVHAFYGILASFPILGLSLLMGSVTGKEFTRTSLSILLTMMHSLGAGLLFSVICRELRSAIAGTFGLLLLTNGLGPLIWLMITITQRNEAPLNWMWLSPAFSFSMAFEENFRVTKLASHYWNSFAVVFATGLFFLGYSCWHLSRHWRGAEQPLPPKNRNTFWWRLRYGTHERLLRLRLRFMEANPYGWIIRRDRLPRLLILLPLIIFLPFWIFSLLLSVSKMRDNEIFFILCFISAYIIHQYTKILIAESSSRRFFEDRQSGAFELICVSAISWKEMVKGYFRSLRHQYRLPSIGVMSLNAMLVFMTIAGQRELHMSKSDMTMFLSMFIGGAVIYPFDCWALTWSGMLSGLRSKSQMKSIFATYARIMFPGYLAVALFFVIMIVIRGRMNDKTLTLWLWIWFLLNCIWDLAVGFWAKRRAYRYKVSESASE